ncbi:MULTISPECIES: OprD family porin [unclassified Pseudomonas]|uniref:OprD family porin n=1 Tax=unclassified Pseudomonas TaxID=196821 RepID=UPI0021C85575|nr:MULTISPECIES: OprD family porin [unclassified Pseudomonas]MCU1732742.1 OprD family porin [Pseudomonas sp. 20P_3.2_Bac4]MCU1745049.1 OprD family porin [Pseudomonas sp. 20P_3.2_Bac5]
MLRTLTPLALAILCSNAHAAFLDDSKASVEARNFYFNRDFRQDGAAQSKAEEWAQGFILRYESGFTEGTLGFGVDAIGLLGLKLDSSPDRAGSGLLQRDREAPKRAQDSSSDLGLTAKVRASNSVLKLGTLIPKLPVLMPNDSRLLPQVFQGGQVTVQEISNLSVDLGRLRQVNQRDSQDYEDMSVTTGAAKNIVVRQTTTDRFDFGHALYKWNDSLSTSYSYGGLENLYRQHMLGLTHTWALGDGQTLKSDLRFARSLDDGGSNIDNKALGAMFTYGLKGHALGLGYQRMSGDTGFAYINGADAYLVNFVQIGDFANKDERSWQARYDFNFASVGIPGLTFMTRYLSGDNVDLGASRPNGKEWERDMDIGYVIQSGPLKNLGVKWRNATVRSTNFGNDLDENRLIVSYTVALW